MLFYFLLAGHLAGDFTFQTNWIAVKKENGLRWIILHAFIVSLCIAFFAIPFGGRLLPFILINGILHIIIDYIKNKLKSGIPVITFLYFIADQVIHILIIYIFSEAFIVNNTSILNKGIIALAISIIFTISFSSVLIQLLLKMLFQFNPNDFYYKNEKLIGNISRAIIFAACLLSYIYSAIFFIIVPLYLIILKLYYKYKLQEWMSIKYFKTKLILEMTFAIIGLGIYRLLIIN